MKNRNIFFKTILILYSCFILFIYNYSNYKSKKNSFLKKYIIEENDFCDNFTKYFRKDIEEKITIVMAKLRGKQFPLYIYKENSYLSTKLYKLGAYEANPSNNMLNALEYYAKKHNINNNKDIYILDIGGNIGWYPSLFGNFGYTILSFEPFERNIYILKKNFCLNRSSNILIK